MLLLDDHNNFKVIVHGAQLRPGADGEAKEFLHGPSPLVATDDVALVENVVPEIKI